jgi:hypothetical protein
MSQRYVSGERGLGSSVGEGMKRGSNVSIFEQNGMLEPILVTPSMKVWLVADGSGVTGRS